MNYHALDPRLKDALSERGYSPEEAEQMSPEKIFSEFCDWHGMIHWGPELYKLAVGLTVQERLESEKSSVKTA